MAVWQDHCDNGSLDATLFGSAVAGTGTVVESGTHLTLTAPTDASAAIAYLLRNVTPAEAAVYVHKVRLTSVASGAAANLLNVLDKASAPVPTDNTMWNANQRINCFQIEAGSIYFGYTPATGAEKYWNGTAWTTTFTAAASLTKNRWVIVIFFHTTTAWKYVLLDGSGSFELVHTDWVLWSDVKAYTTLWMWWGDPYTNYYTATLDSDFFRFGNETQQTGFFNAHASDGSTYQGPRIGRAISLDGGRLFIRNPGDVPVVTAANFPAGESVTDVVWPWCVLDGSTYYLWVLTKTAATGWTQIWCLTSSDGITWTRSTDAAKLTLGSAGQFDAVALAFVTAYKDLSAADASKRWKIYYGGVAADGKTRLGLATCADPTDATYPKHAGNPILDVGGSGAFDEQSLTDFVIVPDGSTLRMFYGGAEPTTGHAQVGEATSPDWIAWTKVGTTPVIARRSVAGTTITTAASGDTAIVVADTSVFTAGEWVALVDAESATYVQLNRIESIETGTGLTLTYPLERAFTGGKIRSVWWGSVTPSAVLLDGSLWTMRPTAFQQVTPAQMVVETVGYADGSAHDSLALSLTDFSALQLGSRWDRRAGPNLVGASAENLTLVTLPITFASTVTIRRAARLEIAVRGWVRSSVRLPIEATGSNTLHRQARLPIEALQQIAAARILPVEAVPLTTYLPVAWDVRAKIDELLPVQWDVIQTTVAVDLLVTWDVRRLVGTDLGVSWNIIPSDIFALYSDDIQLPVGSAVTP